MERDSSSGSSTGVLFVAPEPPNNATGVVIPDPWTVRAQRYSFSTLIYLLAFAMTIPGMVNAFCALPDGSPSTIKSDVEKMSDGMLAACLFMAFSSSLINTLMNHSFLLEARKKIDNSIKPIREGHHPAREIAKLTAYVSLASFAGLASGAMSWDAFAGVPEPAKTPLRLSFSLLNFTNTGVSRFTGLPNLIDNIKEKYLAKKTHQDIANIALATFAAVSVFALFTESGFKGVNIIASKVIPDGLTKLPSLYKIAIGAPAGFISSAFYANHLLELIPTAKKTYSHVKTHQWETIPLFILIILSGFSGALLANVMSIMDHNNNTTNPNGDIFGFKPDVFGYSMVFSVFLFASLVNIKVIAKSHIDTPPELVSNFMKRVKSVHNFFTNSDGAPILRQPSPPTSNNNNYSPV